MFGYYEANRLSYVTRTRSGFTAVTRAHLYKKPKGLVISECPFVNVPEARSGRWDQGVTKAKMAECQWLKPVLVGQFGFLEWTGDNHLRHSKFIVCEKTSLVAAFARMRAEFRLRRNVGLYSKTRPVR